MQNLPFCYKRVLKIINTVQVATKLGTILPESKENLFAMFANKISMRKRLISILAIASTRYIKFSLKHIIKICHSCYYQQVEEKDKKCPNCFKLYEVSRVNDYIKKSTMSTSQNHAISSYGASSTRKVKNIVVPFSQDEVYSSPNISSYSSKNGNYQPVSQKKQYKKSPSQNKQYSTNDNLNKATHYPQQSKLSSVRILQKNILYVIGISPSIAKEEILRRYEYFGQYGRIQQVTINKENAFQSENQGLCYSVYITYSDPKETSIAILAIDQFVYDGRLIRASFGRTKYCKFFLKDTQCLNKDCPYQHAYCDGSEILTQDDMQKKQLFQQCQQLAFQLSSIYKITEDQFRQGQRLFREQNYHSNNSQQHFKSIFPSPESIYEKKSLFKLYQQYYKQQSLAHIQQQQQQTPAIQQEPNELKKQYSSRSTANQVTSSKDQHSQAQDKIFEESKEQIESLNLQKQSESSRQEQLYFEKSLNKEQLSEALQLDNQKSKKRNNSSDDERRYDSINQSGEKKKPQKTRTSLSRVQKFELQLANSLKQHLGDPISDEGKEEDKESLSIFNEKKTSRFLSIREGEENIGAINEQEQINTQQHMMHSRRSSISKGHHQKRNSMQSLIVESLRFLNDDTDIVKREPLIDHKHQQFMTNLPSEVFNIATPVQSHLGGYNEDDYTWNNTLFSQQEYNPFQKEKYIGDDKSYFSHQMQNSQFNHTNDGYRNSVFANSFAQQHPHLLNDSSQYYTTTSNPHYQINNNFMNMSQQPFYPSRKTICIPHTTASLGNTLTRSPSQPKINNVQRQDNTQTTNNSIQNQQIIHQLNSTYQHSSQTKPIPTYHSTSFEVEEDSKIRKLNQYNLEIFDKHNETSKDLLYAKIFLQQDGSSQNNIISSQSIFCYSSQLEEEQQYQMMSERGGFYGFGVPKTPIKERRGADMRRFTTAGDEDELYQSDQFDKITKNSEPKNFYKELHSLKKSSIFSSNFFSKRRNSLEQDRDKLEPQQLSFSTPNPFNCPETPLHPKKKNTISPGFQQLNAQYTPSEQEWKQ